jgi:hypothetical protein
MLKLSAGKIGQDGADLLGTLEQRGGAARINDTFLEVYIQDVSKVSSGSEAGIRNSDTRFISESSEYIEPDDGSRSGFMKSALTKLNSTFVSSKMAEYLNKTSISMMGHYVGKAMLNNVTKASGGTSGSTLITIKKIDA